MRAACRAAVLFALLPRGAGFLQMYQTSGAENEVGWLWSDGAVAVDEAAGSASGDSQLLSSLSGTAGLVGGLRVAVDPRLCAALEERFREDIKGVINYFTCTELHAAVWRALGHWEAAHRAISFVDVTETCAAEGLDELCTVADIYFAPMSLQAEFPPSLFPADVTAIMVADGGDKPRQALLRRTNGEVTYGRPFFKNYVLIKDDDPTLCWCVHAARSAAAGAPARPPPRCPPTPTPTVPRAGTRTRTSAAASTGCRTARSRSCAC